jgi:MFS family permease
LSVFALGAPVGILVGFGAGGWLTERYDWRMALFIVAIPGLLLAWFVRRRLPEPARGGTDGLTAAPALLSLGQTFRSLLANRTFVQVSVATGLYTVLWLGVVQWLPSYFTRSFGLGMGEVSAMLALVLSGSQIVGMLAGGALADRLGQRDIRWYAWLPGLAILISTPVFYLTFTTTSSALAYASLCIPFCIGIMQGPASFAVAQGVADVNMRATAAALLLLITNLIGGGIGPQAVGLLSDYFESVYGDESLRHALRWVALVFGTWSAFHYFWAGRSLPGDFKSRI